MSVVRSTGIYYTFYLQCIYLRANCKKLANGKLKTAATAATTTITTTAAEAALQK